MEECRKSNCNKCKKCLRGPIGPQGPQGEKDVCYCIDKINCFNEKFSSDKSNVLNLTNVFPGIPDGKNPNISSYVNILVDNILPVGTYNGWSLSPSLSLPSEGTYKVYSILDLGAGNLLNSFLSICESDLGVPHPENLCAILYIVNKAQYYEETLGYSSNDIQSAIWTLMFNQLILPFDPTNIIPSAPSNEINVIDIITDAANSLDEVTDCKKVICKFKDPQVALILLPPNCSQALLLQIPLCKLSLNCLNKLSSVGSAEYITILQEQNNLVPAGLAFEFDTLVFNDIPNSIIASSGIGGTVFTLSKGTYIIDYEMSLILSGSVAIYKGSTVESLVIDYNTITGSTIPTTWIHGRSIINVETELIIMLSAAVGVLSVAQAGTSLGIYMARITFFKYR